jgi:hypothetical protein
MGETRCDNCGNPATWSVDEGDGNYCSYACDNCLELRFPDWPAKTAYKRLNA